MIKNLLDVNNYLDAIEEKISSFDTDERKEIKKNNKLIESYIKELEEIEKILFDEIKGRYDKLIPSKNEMIDESNLVDKQYNKLILLSNNSYIFKMDIDKNLYVIRYDKSLDKINENILDLIDKFNKVGIVLNKDNFKYSISLYKYMGNFFDNILEKDINIKMKDTFDNLYWECPDIINHLYLCFMLLLDKYKVKFDSYINNKCNNSDDYNNELDKYYQLFISYNDKQMSDNYLVYEKFDNGTYKIEEYLNNSSTRKDIISKFIDYDKYINLSKEERIKFYDQIKGIYYDLCESLLINKYGYMINKVKDIYSNKNNYLNNYSSFVKTIKQLERQREKINNRLFILNNRINDRNKDRLSKKYNNLFNKVNMKIKEIIDSYNNYDELLLNDNIIKNLNEDSTYYDAFKIFENNYSYLINFMKDNDGNYDEYISFIYNPYLNISKSIPFISDLDIENKLSEKYDLFDIDIDLSDKNKLREDLEYIIRLSYFEFGNINIEKIKLIFDIRKMLGE